MPKQSQQLKISKKSKAPVTLEFREITVHPANIVTALRKAELRRAQETTPNEDPIIQAALWGFYIPMICCSTGDLPTQEEFLTMDELALDQWYQAALEVNPHWFLNEEELQKKGNAQITSTSESPLQ